MEGRRLGAWGGLVGCLSGCGFSKVDPGAADLAQPGELGEPGDAGAPADLTANGDLPARTPKRLFTTREAYTGSMGSAPGGATGVLGGDLLCTNTAASAHLNGVWRAWLSDGQNNAIDRVVGDGPWNRIDGQLAFANHAALAVGPQVPLDLDQMGVALPVNSAVWTGTLPSGVFASDTMPGGGDCSDWTSMSGGAGTTVTYGRNGDTESTDGRWTAIDVKGCYSGARLYCFEQ